jgi:hypothetical protein
MCRFTIDDLGLARAGYLICVILYKTLGAIMRAITFFERDLTHNNVVSGL